MSDIEDVQNEPYMAIYVKNPTSACVYMFPTRIYTFNISGCDLYDVCLQKSCQFVILDGFWCIFASFSEIVAPHPNEQNIQNAKLPSVKWQPIIFQKMKMAPVQRVFSRIYSENRT